MYILSAILYIRYIFLPLACGGLGAPQPPSPSLSPRGRRWSGRGCGRRRPRCGSRRRRAGWAARGARPSGSCWRLSTASSCCRWGPPARPAARGAGGGTLGCWALLGGLSPAWGGAGACTGMVLGFFEGLKPVQGRCW